MRTMLGVVAILFTMLWSACGPVVTTVYAQTLPVTKTLAWDQADEVSAGVTGWIVTLDGTTVSSPTVKTQAVTLTTAGAHTLTVRAVNVWGTSAPSTLSVNVVVPASPSGLRLQ